MKWISIMITFLLINSATADEPSPVQLAMLEKANKIREQYGLQPHQLNEEYSERSQKWAEYMARTGNFTHGGGENIIALASGNEKDSIDRLFRIWMNSPPHRAFILGNGRFAGYGLSVINGTAYAAGSFMDRLDFGNYDGYTRGRRRGRR